MGKYTKPMATTVTPATETKIYICASCKESTRDFYPILGKNQTGVRCSNCQERWVRQSNDS